MSNPKDGGPAFPVAPDDLVGSKGMSLRDWFAGRVAAAAMVNARGITEDVADEAFPTLARISYKLADAMLAARGQP